MKKNMRKIRHKRTRRKLKGIAQRPRLSVFRSNKHMYAQLVDDEKQQTLTFVSTLSKDVKGKGVKSSTKEAAFTIGELIAQKAQDKGIKKVCFDLSGYEYGGKVKEVSNGARKGGLEF